VGSWAFSAAFCLRDTRFERRKSNAKASHWGAALVLVPINPLIGSNPLAQFADWKLASDDAELKGEACLPRKELIRKDAFAYQCETKGIYAAQIKLSPTWITADQRN
jgi:hypothetical protein